MKRPFSPAASDRSYDYGTVVGLVAGESASGGIEVLVYLYDPETAETYADETGQPLFCFYENENPLSKLVQRQHLILG
ncbi:MAG: hypothetical protein HC839_02070 [Leptolyngbyaceae cyanobacterium RM2_2_21]|nr:hypothetical protein [Leptolyngbyaceae cyanobacterium RM2_2_21]